MIGLRLPTLHFVILAGLASWALASVVPAQISLPPKSNTAGKGNVAPYLVCNVCGQRNYTSVRDGRRDKEGNEIAWCDKCGRDTAQRSGQAPADKANGNEGGNLRLPPPATGSTATPATSGPPAAPQAAPPVGPPGPIGPNPPGATEAPGPTNAAAPPDARPGPGDARARDETAARASGAAGFIFGEVRKAQGPDDRLAAKAVESLLALGEPGLAAARAFLYDSEPVVLMTAARVLMHSGISDDIELVKNRVRGKLPPSVGAPLVDELVRSDPVRVNPRYLCELIDSPHAGVRLAAERNLRTHTSPELLPLLEPALASKRAETRLAALTLIADIDDPAVTDLLLAHVADPSSKVASSAVSAVAGRKDADLESKLLAMAFKGRWMLRENAYVLVALVEREDLYLKPILDETQAESLLNGLQSNDPFVAGACATALAGIGFRSPRTKATNWLDQGVMDRLVFTVSGKEFHNDFSALSTPALRRLRLISGQEFGKDGPRWVEWWLGAREGFFARRACIEIDPGDVGHVSVRFQSRGENPVAFALLGPGQATTSEAGRLSGEIFYLTQGEARDLLAVLEREGVFGPDRLPGVRGARGTGERTLEIAVAGRGKSFTFGANSTEPWFERAASAARALRDKNSWQRYPDPRKYSTSLALWQAESEWWAGDHTQLERALRLKSLVLGVLPSAKPAVKDGAVEELARLYTEEHAARAGDFTPLAALIAEEAFYSERTHKLVRLALEAARTVETGMPPAANGARAADPTQASNPADADSSASERALAEGAGASESRVPIELGRDLVNLLHQKFHGQAAPDLAAVTRACGNGFARELARDERPLLRAVAAAALSAPASSASAARAPGQAAADSPSDGTSPARGKPSEADLAVLMKLLEDKDRDVEVAAILALGDNRVEAARTELLVRARLGVTPVRVAALQAIGRLGGDLVLDALVVGASDHDLQVRLAAAKGLAELGDPASTQLLVSMLSEGRDAALFDPVRAGLAKLGKAAWPELLRAAHSPGNRARREATLLLSEQGVPEAASVLMTMLTTTPNDPELSRELAVLTCVDLRGQTDPASAWWNWWDTVVHDDAQAWFLGALERAGLAPPARETLSGAGTLPGRLYLVAVMARPEAQLVERARRELSFMLGRDLGEIPPRGTQRDAWLLTLRESLQHQREQ